MTNSEDGEHSRFGMAQARIRVGSAVTVIGALAAAASAIGFLGAWHWSLDLCAHFRVQYFAVLAGAALLLLAVRRHLAVAVFGTLSAANLALILPLYLGGSDASASDERPLRAFLSNVNSRRGDAAAVARAVRELKPDIVVLEEVTARWLSELAPAMTGFPFRVQEPREDNFGITLFSRFPLRRGAVEYLGDAGVPSVVAEVTTPQGPCVVVATHPVPPAGRRYSRWRNGQLAALAERVRGETVPVLLLGDLNVTPWSSHFRRLLRESGLRNGADGRGVLPTWPTFLRPMMVPLDHCLHSAGVRVVGLRTGPHVGSDHLPLVADFVLAGQDGNR